MAARSALLCQPVGFVPQKYGWKMLVTYF
jgi:hypothetical protein